MRKSEGRGCEVRGCEVRGRGVGKRGMRGEGEKCGETERCDEAREMPVEDDKLSLEVHSSSGGGFLLRPP